VENCHENIFLFLSNGCITFSHSSSDLWLVGEVIKDTIFK
jgi:hypothetical protein